MKCPYCDSTNTSPIEREYWHCHDCDRIFELEPEDVQSKRARRELLEKKRTKRRARK